MEFGHVSVLGGVGVVGWLAGPDLGVAIGQRSSKAFTAFTASAPSSDNGNGAFRGRCGCLFWFQQVGVKVEIGFGIC